MRFLALLKGGATPKFAAEAFLNYFFKRCEDQSEYDLEVAANFTMDCFLSINIKVTITAQDAEDEFKHFQWPVELLRIYVFSYNKVIFTPFERFLHEIFIVTKAMQEEWINSNREHLTENYMDEFLNPLESVMYLIKVWFQAFTELSNTENAHFFNKYLEEPIGRINFQLLRGVRYLRTFYRSEMPLLDIICDILLRTARLGIMYRQSHREVAIGLVSMLKEDFHIFYDFSPSSIEFFYNILTLKCPKGTVKLVYRNFIELLQMHGINYNDLNNENANTEAHKRSQTITNFMVQERMLNLYYHHLVKEKSGLVSLALIEFLSILQGKLATLDCFSEVFMEGILSLVLSNDKVLGNKAAKLYITMIQRLTNAETALRHIIGFYFSKMTSTDLLPRYALRLSKFYRPIRDVKCYTEDLLQRNQPLTVRLMTARFVVTIFHILLKRFGLHNSSTQYFLRKVFYVTQQQQCQFTQGILLNVFNGVQRVIAENVDGDLPELILSFEEHAQRQFDNLENVQYILLKKWFLLWEFFASHKGDLQKINESVSALVTKYNSFMDNERSFFQKLNGNSLHKYRSILQRFCLLTQSNHLSFEIQNAVLSDIQKGLISIDSDSRGTFYEYACQTNILIDVYALEIYTISLIKMNEATTLSSDRTEFEWLKSRVQELNSYLQSWIQNPDLLIKQPFVRIKTLICCFLEIQLIFGSDPNMKIVNLHLETYETIIRIITQVFFKTKSAPQQLNDCDEEMQMHTQSVLSFKRLLIKRFDNFHKCSGVDINSHYVWQFCFYFALPEADEFQNEMRDIMNTLSSYCFPIFQRMIPIIIFNLYFHQPALTARTILNAVRAHKSFLDSLERSDRAMLIISIVISVIERVDESLRPNNINQRLDRLAPLKHLHIFIENLDLRSGDDRLITQIFSTAKHLRRKLLNSQELKTVDEFLKRFHVEPDQ